MPLSSLGGDGTLVAGEGAGCGETVPVCAAPGADSCVDPAGIGGVRPLLSSGDGPPAGGGCDAAAAGAASCVVLLTPLAAPNWFGAAEGVVPLSNLGADGAGWLL
jgi:hypothetical protein